jgi:fluoroacetyl-CoA thioesterase
VTLVAPEVHTSPVFFVNKKERRLEFEVEAHDGVDTICRGRHQRFIINREKFDLKMAQKATQA